MYLSLWADHVGEVVFGGETEPYRHILGDATKEKTVLDFIAARRIESLSLYDLSAILGDGPRLVALLSFLGRARGRGVVEVNGIADTTQAAWDDIASVQTKDTPFDGLVTEIEFWNSGTFQEFHDTLTYVRALDMKARSGAPMKLGVYIGRPSAEEVDSMLPLIDRLYVHVYVNRPNKRMTTARSDSRSLPRATRRSVRTWRCGRFPAPRGTPGRRAPSTSWATGSRRIRSTTPRTSSSAIGRICPQPAPWPSQGFSTTTTSFSGDI